VKYPAVSPIFDFVLKFTYNQFVKRRDLERQLADLGWYFLRHGGNHDVWTDGSAIEYIPRHNEVNENTARKVLRTAWRSAKEKGEKK
jgi:mRNA interferase HicA